MQNTFGHPGKKLLFMGQDFGQMDEWNENKELEWNLLEYPIHSQMQEYVKVLNKMYSQYPALSQMDYHPEGFEWIECNNAAENIAIFVRKTKKKDETLLFVCNFAPVVHEKFQVGVPFAGKYKEILNSDSVEFGGSGVTNPRVKTSKKEEWNERPNSIVINVAPMSVSVFTCTPETPKKAAKKAAGKKETGAGKAEKKAETALAEKKDPAEKTGTALMEKADPKKIGTALAEKADPKKKAGTALAETAAAVKKAVAGKTSAGRKTAREKKEQ